MRIANSFVVYHTVSGGLALANFGAVDPGGVYRGIDLPGVQAEGDGSVRIAFIGRYLPAVQTPGAIIGVLRGNEGSFDGQSWDRAFNASGNGPTEDEFIAAMGDGSVAPNPDLLTTFVNTHSDMIFGSPHLSMFGFSDGHNVGTFDAVPEPGSMALLGLGAVAFLRKRRSK